MNSQLIELASMLELAALVLMGLFFCKSAVALGIDVLPDARLGDVAFQSIDGVPADGEIEELSCSVSEIASRDN